MGGCDQIMAQFERIRGIRDVGWRWARCLKLPGCDDAGWPLRDGPEGA